MESDSGITLVYKAYMDFPVNEDLVSGLLTALNQFTIVEFQEGIESIEMGGLRWVYIQDKETNLLFIAADTKDTRGDILRARLDVIRVTFIQEYASEKNRWQGKWAGNVEIYKPFEKIIDEYYTQWQQAESVTTLAEFFDILGIFQQITNLTINIIEGYISEEKKQSIYEKIEKLLEDNVNLEIVKENPDLNNITFERTIGFNIISIDPMTCDMIVTQKYIKKLIEQTIKILKVEEGFFSCLKYFNEENIFDYLLSNFDLLHDLNLITFFLKLFLLN
ncbi:hypothetical protein LCGC14_1082940 [marine sediment metagenome]|uniref:Uncharacterized protein n=1 Tax=marine sediment metagenome TaxID=412755 RepID=A0A0F9N2C7_9ZZZZ